MAASTAFSFLATTSAPRRPYVLRIDCLTASMAASRSITLLMAKKQVCSTVLVRLPMPAVRATLLASTVHRLAVEFDEPTLHRLRAGGPNTSSAG
jgi:hypothetical protein